MKKVIFILLLITFPHLIFASNWTYVTKNRSGDEFFVETTSIRRSGNEVTYWQKLNYAKRSEFGHLSSKTLYVVNCRTSENALTYLITYSDLDNNGSITSSGKTNIEWTPIPPDSAFASVQRFVCKY